MAIRKDRNYDEIRKVNIIPDIMENAYASILYESGKTKVLCTASVSDSLPKYIDPEKSGWLTAEYNMLPGSTLTRKSRSIYKPDSRGIEIQRLIARALRAAVELKELAGYSIVIDCDVIQADGGTRTASITGGYIVLEMAIKKMIKEKLIKKSPIKNKIASISAGIIEGKPMVDLNYIEDSNAEVDFNIVMNDNFNFIELQGTGEKGDLSRKQLNEIMDLCEKNIKVLFDKQEEILKGF